MSALAARLSAARRRRTGPQGRDRALPAALARAGGPAAGLAVAIAAALAGLAFYARGGVAIESATWSQVGLILAGGGLAALALAAPHRHAAVAPLHGRAALLLLAALTGYTALSISWSLAPADSWLEANRMLAYLAAFAGGLALARLVPHRWDALLHGVALACVAVCGWALLTKVFPEAFAESERFARLRAPFGYWNSVGLMAASGVPALLWLAARRSGHAAVNALAYPALGLLLVTLMLSYSRGALLALAVGLAAWFVAVPLRLRGTLALAVTAAAATGVTAWAFEQDGLTQDRLPMLPRSDAGHELGVLLALMCVVLVGAGLAIGFAAATRPITARARRRAGQALIGGLAAAALAGVVALALAPGGIEGQASKAWTQLTDPQARTPANTPNRLTATASVRARYWREALDVHAQSELLGAGAGAYETARKRFRTGDLDVRHAHGHVVQTLADLGWVGLLLSLAAVAAWLVAAARVLGLRRGDRGLPYDAERVGLLTVGAIVLVFGFHAAIDWTWFVPANAVLALLCAGWIAGRAPLRERLAGSAAAEPRARWSVRTRLLAWRPHPYRSAAALAVLVIAVASAWTTVQPLRAVHAGDAALARLQIGAYAAAADIAGIAHERNPLSVEPLWELAAVQSAAGRRTAAHDALERAVVLQPANAEAWRQLGRYRLHVMNLPRKALEALRAAYYLDPQSPDSISDYLAAVRALQAAGQDA